jgi:O-antigen/teichoic acid export membrane protein
LSYTILQLPIAIIGVSIGQVFFNRCAELVNQKQSTLGILKKTLVSLFLISIVPFGVLFFFGENLFRIFFGVNWSNSGIYSEIMTSWFLMNFLISVISNLPTILNRQKEFFLYGIISAVIQLFCFGVLPLIIGSGNSAFKTVLWSVSIAQSVFFFFVLFKMIEFARKGVKL